MQLPVVSGAQAVAAFRKLGYSLDQQHGSHIILRHEKPPHRRLSIPNHKEFAKGTLRALIREAGLTVDEFRQPSVGWFLRKQTQKLLKTNNRNPSRTQAEPVNRLQPVLRGLPDSHGSSINFCPRIQALEMSIKGV